MVVSRSVADTRGTAGLNDEEVPAFVELTRNRRIVVRFIEYMPFEGQPRSILLSIAH